MKSLITLALSLLVSTSAFSYTPVCEDVVRVAIDFYKSEMQATTDSGYVHMTYTFDGIEMSSEFNLIGLKLNNSLFALDETGEKPVLLNHKFDSNKNLNGIDVYDFSNWRDFVFVIEPEVIKHCKGQYKLYDAADLATISNKKIYNNNRENALEIDEINLKMLFVIENEDNGLVDNSKRDNNLKTELPESNNKDQSSNTITIE